MLPNKTKYALRAVFMLAEKYDDGEPVLISEIARKERIPKKFLEAILLELKNNKILRSKKGKHGGYFLALDPVTVSVGSVMRIFQRSLAPVPCLSKTMREKCDGCTGEGNCKVKMVMKELYDATTRVLDLMTLREVVERSKRKFSDTMYYI
jgi:Rrf2 family protein